MKLCKIVILCLVFTCAFKCDYKLMDFKYTLKFYHCQIVPNVLCQGKMAKMSNLSIFQLIRCETSSIFILSTFSKVRCLLICYFASMKSLRNKPDTNLVTSIPITQTSSKSSFYLVVMEDLKYFIHEKMTQKQFNLFIQMFMCWCSRLWFQRKIVHGKCILKDVLELILKHNQFGRP